MLTDDIEHMSSSYIRGDDDYTPLPPSTHAQTKTDNNQKSW